MHAKHSSRRQFLAQVGQGMLLAGVGTTCAVEMGLIPTYAYDNDAGANRLRFGKYDRLCDLLQDTAPENLLPWLRTELQQGTSLSDLTAAAALANARAFGGEDYIGFHTFMALHPALKMADQLPSARRALPLMKVLYRHASRLKDKGSRADNLTPLAGLPPFSGSVSAHLRESIHKSDRTAAEQTFAHACLSSPADGFNALMESVEEAPEVHRIVLAHRAWDMLSIVGPEHAQTLLRQSLRYCVKAETFRSKYYENVPQVLAKALDQHKLLAHELGHRVAEDSWIEKFSRTLFGATPEQAADAVAAALAEGFDPEVIGEAIAITANQLVLRDAGRTQREVQANKPLGSVHGDSIGVHACDSANAWRHIARVSNQRNACASLILAGYQVALDRVQRGGNFLEWQPRPLADQLAKITATTPEKLLSELDGAIREKNQDLACALTQRYCDLGFPVNDVFAVCLKFALSEDGALHAEKFYWTVTDEYARTRTAFRTGQLVALSRVTASAFGYSAPGYTEACELLGEPT